LCPVTPTSSTGSPTESASDPALSAPIDLRLLPATAAVSPDGRLAIGGCDLGQLAGRFGTPLFVYDEAHLRDRCREYVAAFGADGVAYAGKAFLCRAMVRLVAEEGLHLDVATGGELHVALSAGFPPDRIVFHGNNKSGEELSAALGVGVGRIVADSFAELDRLEALVKGGLPTPPGRTRVMLRVTPGVEAHTHEYIETGTEDSKFGFPIRPGDALEAARRVAASPHLELAGLHCHIGSQIHVLQSYAAAAAIVVGLATEVEAAAGPGAVKELNLGGGLGIAYHDGDEPPTVAEYAAVLHRALDEALADAGLAHRPALLVEPGRSIAATAGVTLYRVGTIKEIAGVRTYVAVDGGMSDNARPATYGARYEAFLPERVMAERPLVATVAGKHCEQGDLLVRNATLPADVAVGDLLCTPATGAYGYAMASNYNKVPRPAVVFVAGGQARRVVRRETLDDLLRLEEE
jgi:diaminopimelate decarboxylase